MITNPVTLLPNDELVREVSLMQARAVRKIDDATRRLRRELASISESAQRQLARLDGGMDPDLHEARAICDTKHLADAIADLRAAEMMAATVAEFIADGGQG